MMKQRLPPPAAAAATDLTLIQLRILVAICDHDLNISAAAETLGIAQPSVSKRLAVLEQIIGEPLFVRNGKRLQYETDLCRQIVSQARNILLKCDDLRLMGAAAAGKTVAGSLAVGTTHTQARYILPPVIAEFRRDYANIAIEMMQGSPTDLVRLLASNRLDMVVCTESLAQNPALKTMHAYSWNRSLIVPHNHALAVAKKITLQQLTRHPIITYSHGFTGRRAFEETFTQAGLQPKIMVSAADADVIKTYVRLGLGVGVVGEMAYDAKADKDLTCHSLAHLFPTMQVYLAYQKEKFITAGMQRFIELFRRHSRELASRMSGSGKKTRTRA